MPPKQRCGHFRSRNEEAELSGSGELIKALGAIANLVHQKAEMTKLLATMVDRLPERDVPLRVAMQYLCLSVVQYHPLRWWYPTDDAVSDPPPVALVVGILPLVDDRWLYRQFRDCNLPTFQGSLDPKVAKDWIEELERIFQVMHCTEEEKYLLAIFII